MSAFKNYYYRIVKSRSLKLGLVILAALLLVIAAVSWRLGLGSPDARAQFLLKHPSVTKILPLYWKIRKISDITYFSYFFKEDNIPNYELLIAEDDLKKMNDALPEGFMNVMLRDENKVFVPAEFRADGKTYKAQVRYRGANAIHWNAPKRSYLVRFEKNDLFGGMRELNFIIPDDRFFAVERTNNYRARKLGLKVPESGYSNLEVSGQSHALYFTIEGWSDEMLERWDLSKGSILYSAETGEGGMWKNVSGFSIGASTAPAPDTRKLEELIDLYQNASDEQFQARIFELIDKENFYAWQVHQELANSSHQGTGNQRLYWNAEKEKFFFIPWDVEMEKLADQDHFGNYETLAKRVFLNPIFLAEKNQRLQNYLADPKNLQDDLEFYDSTYNSFKVSLYKDRLKIYTNRFADGTYEEYRQQIIKIFSALKNKFGSVRIEDDFNLAYPEGKSDELVSYLKSKYIEDQSFVHALGSNFTSTYADEDFTDVYFDTPKFDLYARQAGLRHRMRGQDKELIQLKLSGEDKFADRASAGSRNELKFEVKRGDNTNPKDDVHSVLSLIAADKREEFKSRLLKLGIDAYDLRPIVTVSQHRRRVYLNRDGETFISFSVDDAASKLWWADASFSQMEVELNELAYTGANETTRKKMQEIRRAMIEDLRGHFDYLQDDKTIKYTKMFDLLDEHLPWMKFLIRIGILRGK